MKTVILSLAVAMGLFAVGCAADNDNATPGDEQDYTGAPDPQGFGAAAPQAAVNGQWTDIAQGYVPQIKNYATYNDPTGGLVRVHVTGCQVLQLAFAVRNSFGQPINAAPAGSVRNFDNSVDMYWYIPAQNLGFVTVWAWAPTPQACYANVAQLTR